MEKKTYDCYKCGEIEKPLVSVTIEFIDGWKLYETIGCYETEEEIIEIIREIIKENSWEDEVTDFSYGYYCPYCLTTLD